ncbi:hypothetical protein VIBNISO65_960007 [Vibrio nigripulchritudo SO65]|nr:hypothetical protein VIBNIAM115_620007 [Vibrio nigripulchritudo AM115]CCN41674.1 hypothetical protein VIBNIFTn2_170007 [Vibrio nigripulchritudo FTn2]CCN63376.1 hypothetical protein VIBNIPon4_1250006 [Vibrio nigripulchritudo POn4]CCN79438.1 hypothetical protein VIBNISO65_960007 [Vibrio nigripulchritudo SO65]
MTYIDLNITFHKPVTRPKLLITTVTNRLYCLTANWLQKNHQTSTSDGLIARLAADDKYKGKSFGEWLLIDTLRKLLAASDSVAFPVVIIDAKDSTKHFYKHYGFKTFQDVESKLFITITDIRASLG